MAFARVDLVFEPGIYSNRSRKASRARWVDGDLVRFRDGVPAQVGGWRELPLSLSGTITGKARGIIGWRPNSQKGRYAAIGTHNAAFLYDGASVTAITPTDLGPGREDSVIGAGYGTGLYGSGSYGTERSASGTLLSASTWSFDLFGETCLGCFSSDGKIREFTVGDVRFVTIAGAPLARAVCVSPQRHVFAFGADNNPRLVMWSDREDYTVWTPSATNRAGAYEMNISSPFQCGHRVRGSVLGWTETEVVIFFPLNNALVYGRETLTETAGAAGPNAVCVVTEAGGEVAYWMSLDGFYTYDGTVRRLPCELQDYVFDDINRVQKAKFEAASNVEFDEIRFSYCSAGSNEIDRCVTYNFANGTWSKANVARLAWLDRKIFDKPLAVDALGNLYEHEVGVTADGATMASYVISHPITIGAGDRLGEVDAFYPDLSDNSFGANVSLLARYWAGDPMDTYGPRTFVRTDEKVDFAVSAREIQLRVDGVGGYWELGMPQLGLRPGGMR